MWFLSSLAAALCTPPLKPSRASQNTAAPLVSIAATQPSDLDAVLDLTVEVFFGVLGNDYGFNNNRAMAFYELAGLQRESLREHIGISSKPRTEGCDLEPQTSRTRREQYGTSVAACSRLCAPR